MKSVLDKLVGTQLAQQIGLLAGEGTAVDGLRYQPPCREQAGAPPPHSQSGPGWPSQISRWIPIKRGEPVEVEK